MSLSYDKTTWATKEIVTTDGLNNMEEGIAMVADAINDIVIDTSTYAAGNHNGHFRGEDLTNTYTIDEIVSKISGGTFEDLYIGDYYDLDMTVNSVTETVRWVFAGFDCFYQYGDTALTSHHAIMVPLNCFSDEAAMLSDGSTTGGYTGSEMWTLLNDTYTAAIQDAWGSDNVLAHRQYLTTTMTSTTDSMAGAGETGASTAGAWTDVYVSLMNEPMITGATICSSSRWDSTFPNQLPLFRLAPHYRRAGLGGTSKSSRTDWWTSAVASSTDFVHIDNSGNVLTASADEEYGVRPYFLLA